MTASGLEFRTRELLPIQLRLEGLQKRLAYAQRTARTAKQNQMNGLPSDLHIHIEIGARAHTMSHIRRGFSGIIKTLCISIDGSLPDGDDWYGAALCQVQGTGRGRRSILSPDLCARLRDLANDPSCPDLDLPDREMLIRLRDQLDTAADLTPDFISQLQLLDADLASGVLFDGRPANPEFAARHENLLAKADLRRTALEHAWARIKQHCDSLGRQIILFGSLLEGRVHAQSDLDLFLPETDLPEVTRRQLWNDIEDFAHDECVMADVHFADDYNSTFPDTIKVIFKDSIQPLRVLAERERP